MNKSRQRRTRHLATLSLAISFLLAGAAGATPYQEAVEELARLVEVEPSAATWNDFGALLFLHGDRDRAVAAFEEALNYDSEHPAALYNLAVAVTAESPYRARRLLRTALRTGGDEAWIQFRLGEIYASLSRSRRAVRHFGNAFRANPSLAFADVNPAVVGNPLVTRAVLKVDTNSTVRGEPQFANPSMVRGLLLVDYASDVQQETTVDEPQNVSNPAPVVNSNAPVEVEDSAAELSEEASPPAATDTDVEERRQRRRRNLPPPRDDN